MKQTAGTHEITLIKSAVTSISSCVIASHKYSTCRAFSHDVAILVFHIFKHGRISSLILCKHARSPHEKMLEKISCVGIDPVLIPDITYDPECLPPVESMDLLSFLVPDTSYYSKNQFKAYRSLQTYNQLVSGFVSSIKG